MTNVTIAWLILPFLIGFVVYLVPKLDRILALGMALVSLAYAVQIFLLASPLNIQLLDSFGVSLIVDRLSSFFILTNALVTAAVVIYCWQTEKTAFFYMQIAMLHGSVNATFICADFISLYVALEVISIAAFLLIAYPRTDRSIWVGLRYLFISNVAMLFYLMGAILLYQAHHSFNYAGLRGSPTEAIALIFLGLLVKGGIFIPGLWLPLTHSESETPVSAMLSGVVVKAGVFPLLRCALLLEEIDPIVRLFGVCTALLGVGFAVLEKDTKRMLAFHTISQLGFVLAAPVVGGFYALTHGLVKSALFLIAGVLPSRNFKQLQHQPIDSKIWVVLVIASFSISGFPLLSGFGAKVLSSKNFLPWQIIGMNIAALGTAISFAKFIFLPRQKSILNRDEIVKQDEKKKIQSGFWWAMVILLGGLVGANIFYYQAYTLQNTIKPLITIILGWLAYFFIFKKLAIKLPRNFEKFDSLIGTMSLILILLFWMLWAQFQFST
ncbi:cation:proton antiporter [Waterburya agarophytonicola K14]|uniref:Cation:proton antiporter n=1 Tax=Waterburya agarophytonicola KI4 TaxID=2874699 RepID=A0A964BW20_9CYAN|nr:cation:proton antiporter [Waterburya agarophytonicola]MCC0179631.1 cation:proton antiporter [Waterburya agarophytonicola KI4]